MRGVTSLLMCSLALAPVASAEDLPAVSEVLERFVEAVGGRATLERIELRRCRGTIVQDLSWHDPPHSETPFVVEADAHGTVRYAESESWADLPADDDGALQRKLRWIVHPRFALVVETFFPGLRVTGREMRAGRSVIVLAPADLPYEHYALYFDEATGLLAHVGYHNDLQDWREVDGVRFPSRWVFGRKGGHTTYRFDELGTAPQAEDAGPRRTRRPSSYSALGTPCSTAL